MFDETISEEIISKGKLAFGKKRENGALGCSYDCFNSLKLLTPLFNHSTSFIERQYRNSNKERTQKIGG